MKNTAYQMLKAAIADGYTVTCYYDDPSDPDYTGTSLPKAWEAATACDMMNIRISKDGAKSEWALIVPGNAPDETLSDYVVDGWIDAWWEANVTI